MSDLKSVLTQMLGAKVVTEALGAERLAQNYQVEWSLFPVVSQETAAQ